MSDNEQEVTEHIEHQHDNTLNWNKSAKADEIFCLDSANKSLPIHISWATADKSEQQKASRRRLRGYRKIKKKC